MAMNFPQYNPYQQYNPIAPYQQRYDQMQQMQQQYPQSNQQFQNQQPMSIKGWAVASEEDARKAMIDLDGSAFLFPDVQNGRVYSKQINTADFSPVFKVYQLLESPQTPVQAPVDLSSYVPREDFNALSVTVQGLQETLQQITSGTGNKRIVKEADAK